MNNDTTNTKGIPTTECPQTPPKNYITTRYIKYAPLILDTLLLATAMFDGFLLGAHHG